MQLEYTLFHERVKIRIKLELIKEMRDEKRINNHVFKRKLNI